MSTFHSRIHITFPLTFLAKTKVLTGGLVVVLESQDDLSIDEEPQIPSILSDNNDGLKLMSELNEEEKEGVEDDSDDGVFEIST